MGKKLKGFFCFKTRHQKYPFIKSKVPSIHFQVDNLEARDKFHPSNEKNYLKVSFKPIFFKTLNKKTKQATTMNDSLYRIPSKGQLGGVAAGLSERFGIDVSIIRVLLFLGLVFTHGIFFWMYIILWIALPVKHQWETTATPDNATFNSTFTNMKKDSSKVWGIILIVLGTIFLLDEWIPDFDFGKFWPLILIGVGGYIIFKEKDKIDFNNDKNNF